MDNRELAACGPAATTASPTAAGPTAVPSPTTLSTNEPNFGPGFEPIGNAYRSILDSKGFNCVTKPDPAQVYQGSRDMVMRQTSGEGLFARR